MPNSISTIPEMEVGLIVITPIDCIDITANRKYVVEKMGEGVIYIKNNSGIIAPYSAYQFMEADLYITICLFTTMINIFKLGNKAYK